MGKVKKLPNELHPSEILRQNLKKSSTKITTKNGAVKKNVAKNFTPYKCRFCEKNFTDKYNRTCHEKIHSDTIYPCSQCSYNTNTKKYLARHVKKVHNAPTQHKCHVCGKMFHHKCNLNEHVMVHTGEKPHKCDVCGKAFRVMYSLKSHMLVHTNEKPFKCSFCVYACRDSSTLRKHEQRHMGVVKTFACKLCSKKFPEKAKLKYHISEIHLDYLDLNLRKVTCDLCNKTFRSKYSLRIHIRTVHEKSLRCTCPVCGQRVSSRVNLPAHLRTHFTERPHACAFDGCGKRFKDKNGLKRHSIIHTPERHHACAECGARFTRAHRLRVHEATHAPRTRRAECDHCGDKFYTKNYLIKHIKSKHSVDKEQFECEHCGLVTKNKPSIVMHLKYGHSHDGDTYCDICKREYGRHINLKLHYLRIHKAPYKPMKRRKKEDKPLLEQVKADPSEVESFGKVQLLKVHKEEIVDEEGSDIENDLVHYSKHVLSEDLADCLLEDREAPENSFDQFLLQHVFHKKIKEEKEYPTEHDVDKEQELLVAEKIKKIIKVTRHKETTDLLKKKREREEKLSKKKRAREEKLLKKKLKKEAKLMKRRERQEKYELERVRQMYNERMKKAVEDNTNKKEPPKTIKYFKQKTKEISNREKQMDSTNDAQDKEHSENLNDDLRNKNDSNDSNVNYSNDDYNVASKNITTNVSFNTTSNKDTINDNIIELHKDSINDIIIHSHNDSINDNIESHNDSIDEMIDSSNKHTNQSVNVLNKLNMTKEVKFTSGSNNTTNDVTVNCFNCEDGLNDKLNDHKNDSDDRNDDACNDNGGTNKNDDLNDDDKTDAGSDYEPDEDDFTDNDDSAPKKGLKFKTHQCYVCFKLYPTKEAVIAHCSTHFPVCSARTLAKCPVCGHVAHAHITQHMWKEHGVRINIPYNDIKEKDNKEGSRYCYELKNTTIEIIPSVKMLNHSAARRIDRENRERRDKTVASARLVKKGKEWVIEKVNVDISFEELPEFTERELSKLPVTDSYADRLGQLNTLAKKRGIKMMFPCDRCEKICQNLSALKLHGRRHDPNKKPFAPRKYKRGKKPTAIAKEKPKVTNLENRFAKPQPIKHKHKCDEKLKRFYETHIRGADIEFWQFLKIYNKMDRENIRDFKDFEGRTEFGIHTNEDRNFNDKKTVEIKSVHTKSANNKSKNNSKLNARKIKQPVKRNINNTKNNLGKKRANINKLHLSNVMSSSKLIKHSDNLNKPFKRVILISKRQQIEREKVKMKLREKIKQ